MWSLFFLFLLSVCAEPQDIDVYTWSNTSCTPLSGYSGHYRYCRTENSYIRGEFSNIERIACECNISMLTANFRRTCTSVYEMQQFTLGECFVANGIGMMLIAATPGSCSPLVYNEMIVRTNITPDTVVVNEQNQSVIIGLGITTGILGFLLLGMIVMHIIRRSREYHQQYDEVQAEFEDVSASAEETDSASV